MKSGPFLKQRTFNPRRTRPRVMARETVVFPERPWGAPMTKRGGRRDAGCRMSDVGLRDAGSELCDPTAPVCLVIFHPFAAKAHSSPFVVSSQSDIRHLKCLSLLPFDLHERGPEIDVFYLILLAQRRDGLINQRLLLPYSSRNLFVLCMRNRVEVVQDFLFQFFRCFGHM
jgi:hypothetical protein